METIFHLRDGGFKLIFKEPELFIEFLHDYIGLDIFKDIKPEDIEDIDPRHIPLFQDSLDSDTIKKIHLRNYDKQPLFVITILEHESRVNYRTSFKILQYITFVLSEYEKEINKETEKISYTKDFKFPPVLPIVYYDGTTKWTAETNFLNKTKFSDVFERYIPKFEYELVCLKDYSMDDITKFGNSLSLIMMFDKIHAPNELKLLKNLPDGYIEKLCLNIPDHLNQLIADFITLLMSKINVPKDEIKQITETIYQRRYHNMFAWTENYDVQETRRIAKEEGEERGIKIVAKNLLQMGEDIMKVIKATGLSEDEILKLSTQ